MKSYKPGRKIATTKLMELNRARRIKEKKKKIRERKA